MKRWLTLFAILTVGAGAARADFSGDLLAAYFFDGSGEDVSGKGQHGQLVGATFTTDRHGREFGAVLLDGQGAYVATPVNGKRFPLSFSFWFRLDDRPGLRPYAIVDSGIGEAFGHSYNIGSGPDRLNAHLASTFSFAKGAWTHVVVTYGPKLRVYMNGQLAGEKDHDEADDFVAGNFQVGRHFGSEDGRYFPGAVDDLLIYGRTISEEEVRLLYEGSATVQQHIALAAQAKAELARQLAPGRDAVPDDGAVRAPQPVVVAVSSGAAPNTNGWNAVDGDSNTAWEGAPGEAGWWLAVQYEPPISLTRLDLAFAEGSATNVAAFYSEDANDWPELDAALEHPPVAVRFLLLTFPADDAGARPAVAEVRWE